MNIIAKILILFSFAIMPVAANQNRENQEQNIHEAVFRYQFDHNASGMQKNAEVYFLKIGAKGDDPSDDFMKRFTDHKPPVRKASVASFVKDKGLLDKNTGQKGIVFRASTIKWISETEVVVNGGYYEGNLSASDNSYTLKWDNNKWKVTKSAMNSIS